MLITIFTPKYEIRPAVGFRIWRECEQDSLFIFWRNIDSIQAVNTDVIIRQTGMVYQLVFTDDAAAKVAYEAFLGGI
jgi:hypothetical protein